MQPGPGQERRGKVARLATRLMVSSARVARMPRLGLPRRCRRATGRSDSQAISHHAGAARLAALRRLKASGVAAGR